MNEVLLEMPNSEQTSRGVDSQWAFLCKNICRDHELIGKLVSADVRNRFVTKILRMRQHQLQQEQELERTRKIEEQYEHKKR